MHYRITVTQIEEKDVPYEAYLSADEIRERGLVPPKDEKGKEGGGRVDSLRKEVKSTEIYEQRVEEIDLKAVIDAVNKSNKS